MADDLRVKITSGELPPGGRLPSERMLVEEYGIAPATARQAVNQLKVEGLVVGFPGRGVFVKEQPLTISRGAQGFSRATRAEGKAAFQAEIEAQGRRWSQEVLELAEVAALDWVASWLGVEAGALIFVRRRRNWVDDAPVQIADSYYRLETVAGTLIREQDTGPGGSYARLEEAGHRLERFREEIAVRMPNPAEVRALRLAPGTPVAELRRIAFTEVGAVEVLASVVAGDRHRFVYEFPAPE
jgi:GntR family transcriptional regulator